MSNIRRSQGENSIYALLIQKDHSLRRFAPSDLESVININRVCLPENYAAYFFMDTFNSHPESFIVTESQGNIVGYIMCRVEHGFSDMKKLRFAKKGHIISVAVMPDFRRLGMGSALVTEALSALSSLHVDECYLEVRITNDAAIRLYKKLEFDIVRTIPRYYYDGSDAYVMAKELTQGSTV
jgi:ribosomal-protein-alanine N-acetyltransferase